MSDSFTDLRLNRQDGQVQESFWPSFTDIMTVVVMIFLIAMVVLLLRNMELVNQLRATMEAERIAAELARATGEEKDSLSVALHQAEEQVQMMQLEIMRLSDQTEQKSQTIAQQKALLGGMTTERDELLATVLKLKRLRDRLEADVNQKMATITAAEQNIESLNNNLADLQTRFDLSQSQLANVQQNYEQSQSHIDELQTTVSNQTTVIENLRTEYGDVERKYLVLVGDYDNLKVKYDKLIKPARSAKGRHLVEVRYFKQGDEYKITWREGKTDPYQPITRERLDKILTRLDGEKENGLYVKVVFPEDSGLSYAEAWSFTSHLHRNYDYYFKTEGR